MKKLIAIALSALMLLGLFAGCTAAVAREDKSDTSGIPDVSSGRGAAHHDDVCVAERLCDIPGHVEAVARTGIAEYYVFFHYIISLVIIYIRSDAALPLVVERIIYSGTVLSKWFRFTKEDTLIILFVY